MRMYVSLNTFKYIELDILHHHLRFFLLMNNYFSITFIIQLLCEGHVWRKKVPCEHEHEFLLRVLRSLSFKLQTTGGHTLTKSSLFLG